MNRILTLLLAAVSVMMVQTHCMELMHTKKLDNNLRDTASTSFVHAYSIEGQEGIALFPQGILLLKTDTTFNLFNVLTQKKVTLQNPPEPINTEDLLLDLSSDGKTLAIRVTARDVVIWDAQTGVIREDNKPKDTHITDNITSIAFSPTGDMLLTASHYSEELKIHGIQLLDVTGKGSFIKSFYGHTSPIWEALFSAHDKTVLTYSDNTVKSHNMYTNESQELLKHTNGKIMHVQRSSNEDTIITAIQDSPTIFVWNPKTKAVQFEFTEHTANITHLEISPDDTTVLSGDDQHTWFLWDKETGQVLQKWKVYDECSFSYAENSIVAVMNVQCSHSSPNTTKRFFLLFDSKTGESLKLLKDEHIKAVDVSKDKDTLVTAGQDLTSIITTTAKLWSIKKEQLIQELPHKRPVIQVRFINDALILTQTDDKILHIWKRSLNCTEGVNLSNDSQECSIQ